MYTTNLMILLSTWDHKFQECLHCWICGPRFFPFPFLNLPLTLPKEKNLFSKIECSENSIICDATSSSAQLNFEFAISLPYGIYFGKNICISKALFQNRAPIIWVLLVFILLQTTVQNYFLDSIAAVLPIQMSVA